MKSALQGIQSKCVSASSIRDERTFRCFDALDVMRDTTNHFYRAQENGDEDIKKRIIRLYETATDKVSTELTEV